MEQLFPNCPAYLTVAGTIFLLLTAAIILIVRFRTKRKLRQQQLREYTAAKAQVDALSRKIDRIIRKRPIMTNELMRVPNWVAEIKMLDKQHGLDLSPAYLRQLDKYVFVAKDLLKTGIELTPDPQPLTPATVAVLNGPVASAEPQPDKVWQPRRRLTKEQTSILIPDVTSTVTPTEQLTPLQQDIWNGIADALAEPAQPKPSAIHALERGPEIWVEIEEQRPDISPPTDEKTPDMSPL